MAERMKADHEKPNYGGSVKPTSPDIKKSRATQHQTDYQRDNARADAKFNRGAAKPWHSKGKPAASKGSCDVPGDMPSKRRNDPTGVLKKGYTKK